MILMWFKRILVCSTFAGGCYISYLPRNKSTCFYHDSDEQSELEDSSSFIYLPKDSGSILLTEIDSNESTGSFWTFWRKSSLPAYWKFMMLSKSKDIKVRHKAVQSLSKLNKLEKWQYDMIAQACDVNTAIGLARNFSTSPHFFLHSPFKDLEEGNLQNELYFMLSSLQLSNIDICIQRRVGKIFKSSKDLLKTEYNVDLEVGDPSVIYHSQQKKKAVFSYHKLCLEVFLDCSAKSYHREIMMKQQILKLLLKVLRLHENDVKIKSLIARILANLSMDQIFRNSIHRTGWVGILSEWKKLPHISINLPAAKALANLDTDDISHPLYDDGVYVLNPLCRLSYIDLSADVIFIHGLLGGTFWTWRQCDTQNKTNVKTASQNEGISNISVSTEYSMCWPKDWLAADIPSLRIISVDYKTYLSNWSSCCPEENEKDSVTRRAREVMNKLLLSNVGERPIIWIAHSMGGLIVKQILAEAIESKDEKIQSLVKKTAGMVFYSVPHEGSDLATKFITASTILQLSNDITELQKGSTILLYLHEKFKAIITKYDIPILSFGETKKSRWGLSSSILVPSDSANPGFGEFFLLPADHLSTCKPVSRKSVAYIKVLNFLQVNLSKIKPNKMHLVSERKNIFEISNVICLIP